MARHPRWPVLKALQQSGLPPAVRAIGSLLACHTNSECEAWPSQATIVRESGYSRNTVRTSVRHLESIGWLDAVRDGPNALTTYRWNMESVLRGQPVTPAENMEGSTTDPRGVNSSPLRGQPLTQVPNDHRTTIERMGDETVAGHIGGSDSTIGRRPPKKPKPSDDGHAAAAVRCLEYHNERVRTVKPGATGYRSPVWIKMAIGAIADGYDEKDLRRASDALVADVESWSEREKYLTPRHAWGRENLDRWLNADNHLSTVAVYG